jgi:hypothetical protein
VGGGCHDVCELALTGFDTLTSWGARPPRVTSVFMESPGFLFLVIILSDSPGVRPVEDRRRKVGTDCEPDAMSEG